MHCSPAVSTRMGFREGLLILDQLVGICAAAAWFPLNLPQAGRCVVDLRVGTLIGVDSQAALYAAVGKKQCRPSGWPAMNGRRGGSLSSALNRGRCERVDRGDG